MKLAFCLCLLSIATIWHRPLSAEPKTVDRIAAIVGNEVITQSELNDALAAQGKALSVSTGQTNSPEQTRRDVLQRLIDDLLFDAQLKKSKIEVSDEDVQKAIANIIQENRITIDRLREELAKKGVGFEQYKRQVKREIRRAKYINQVISPQVKISDQDLRDFYQRNQEKFRASKKAHIAQILFPLTPDMTQEQFINLRDTAMSVSQQGRSNPSSFATLAKKYSKGPNADNGGDLGMVDLKDLPPEVASIAQRLQIGDVSHPVLTDTAVVIVKLIALPELSAADFESLRDNIYNALYEQRIDEALTAHLQQQRQKSFIDIRQ